jgi:tetraacyldisaccharide 4'-kinase
VEEEVVAESWLALVSGSKKGILPTVGQSFLRLLSYPYSLVMRLRNLGYDLGWLSSEAVNVPVIVVGNLTVGGTGKTPAVEYIARFLRERDQRVTILSRGYGSEQGRNDEAMVLEDNLDDVPHLQGTDRVRLAKTAIEELESDVLLLDDGFQHRRLKRNCDILLIDATNPWGYGYTLPGGLLREPISGLMRAHLVIITHSNFVPAETLQAIKQYISRIVPACPVALSQHQPKLLKNTSSEQGVEALRGRKVAAFCGIGNPSGFWKTLTDLGCELIDSRQFADHHQYQRSDVDDLMKWASALPADTWIITTQKDWVKLRIDSLADKPLYALSIALVITEGEELLQRTIEPLLHRVLQDEEPGEADSLLSSCKDAYDSANTVPV